MFEHWDNAECGMWFNLVDTNGAESSNAWARTLRTEPSGEEGLLSLPPVAAAKMLGRAVKAPGMPSVPCSHHTR